MLQKSHGTHVNESGHTYGRVTSHMRMGHVTHGSRAPTPGADSGADCHLTHTHTHTHMRALTLSECGHAYPGAADMRAPTAMWPRISVATFAECQSDMRDTWQSAPESAPGVGARLPCVT